MMTELPSLHKAPKEQANTAPWYAIKTFNCKELDVKTFFTDRNIESFIPMVYSNVDHKKEKVNRHLVPAIHNLIFIQSALNQKQLASIIAKCQLPMSVYTKAESNEYSPITEKEMAEIRLLCDPDYELARFVPRKQAEAKIGKQVKVVKGPFGGITGKLARYKDEYFFIKTVFSMGVMIRISRWYCEVL